MLQTLFHIPAEIAGYPVFGFGLLLAVWAVASVAMLAWLAWRQGFNADTWGYVPILLLLGAMICWVLPALCEPRGLPIRGYGVMMLLAVVAGTLLAAWRAKRVGVDPDLIFSLAFWMIVPGIIGARAFYVIEYWQTEYWPAYTESRRRPRAASGRHRERPQGRTGGLRGVFWRRGRPAGLRPKTPPAVVGPVRSDRPQHGVGPGHRADRLPDERLLFRGRLRPPLGDQLSGQPAFLYAALPQPGRAGADVRLHLERQSGRPTAAVGRRPHSPADHAGLKPGDRLRNINGKDVVHRRGCL